MKKKHRDIIVEGVKYGWIGRWERATVYKDKKVWFSFEVDKDRWIIPSMVANAIKKELDKQ